MKKKLLDKETAQAIVSRVQGLRAGTQAAWGDMNATEMLLHLNLCNKQILEGDLEYKRSSLKQRLIRFLSLYIVPNFPKNLRSEQRNITTGKIAASRFEEQKSLFIQIILNFAEHKEPIELTHPAFGNLNTAQWGIAAWKHTDHHLRQFGL